MSHYSRTYTVSDFALRRFEREIERNERHMQRQMEEELDRQAEQAARDLARARNEMNSRLERAVSGMNKEMGEMDQRHRQQVQALSDRVFSEIEKNQKDILKTLNDSATEIHSRIDKVTASMEEKFRDQQSQISAVNTRVDTLFERISQDEAKMVDAVNATSDLLQAVSSRTPVAIYEPLQYNRLMNRVKELMTSKDPATTKIALAREICNSIWEMEEDTVLAKAKHDAVYNMAVSRHAAVLNVVHSNRTKDIQPNGVDTYKIETDYWTRNAYSKLEKRLNELHSILSGDPDSIKEEELKAIISEVAELEQNSIHLVEQAVSRSILSERRVEMTEDIVNALIEQGWQVKNEGGVDAVNYLGGEEQNDQREGVYAILSGPEGQEITVLVSPDSQEEHNAISFHRNDDREMTEDEYMQSLTGIQKEIEKCGIKLGESRCSSGDRVDQKIPEMASGEALSKKGSVSRLKEQTKFAK